MSNTFMTNKSTSCMSHIARRLDTEAGQRLHPLLMQKLCKSENIFTVFLHLSPVLWATIQGFKSSNMIISGFIHLNLFKWNNIMKNPRIESWNLPFF